MKVEPRVSVCEVMCSRECANRTLNVVECDCTDGHIANVIHGFCSIFRGSIEMISVIGNMIIFAFDLMDFLDRESLSS